MAGIFAEDITLEARGKQMTTKLAEQVKEDLLDVLNWCTNGNRKLALDCIAEIAERSLQDVNEYLKAQQQAQGTSDHANA